LAKTGKACVIYADSGDKVKDAKKNTGACQGHLGSNLHTVYADSRRGGRVSSLLFGGYRWVGLVVSAIAMRSFPSPIGVQLLSGSSAAWSRVLGRAIRRVHIQSQGYKGSASSLLRRMTIEGDFGSALHVVVKLTARQEAQVYQKLAEWLPIDVPHAYCAEVSGDDGLCVLEDLMTPGRDCELTLVDEQKILSDLARLHAAFWQLAAYDDYAWLPWWRDEVNAGLDKAERGLALMQRIGGWPGVMGRETMAVMERLLSGRARLLAPLEKLPPTLIHGDAWLPNWVLLDNRRCLLDWQSAARGPAVWDAVYFLEMSGEAGRRLPMSEDEALAFYFDRLRDNGQFEDGAALAARAASVVITLSRWPAYAADYLHPVERYPALAGAWKRLPARLKDTVAQRVAWTSPDYYQETFARFEKNARDVYGIAV
jgi:aminoglycoside/choline kinase family phosphotransferase